jgi:tetratricopeptide (TPR) repeat protein
MSTIKEARGLVLKTVTERRGRILKTGDDMVVSCIDDATEALKTAITIQRSAVENRDKKVPLNIRFFIHSGDDSATEEDIQRDLSAFVVKMSDTAKPGHIYVSTETYNSAQGLNAVEFRPLEATSGQLPYYDVAWHPETDCAPGGGTPEASRAHAGGSGPFMHATALLAGAFAPCFYCGSKRHATTACPSKHLAYASTGLEKLGYLSMNEINRLFSDYLNRSGEDLPVIPEPGPKEERSLVHLAPLSFYELKRVFQLRFLDVVWNASSKADWHKARERKVEGFPEGGMLWLARDCIRTGRIEEAEDLLSRYGRRNQGDYRTSCGLAFAKIERGSYVTAADLLNEALNQPTGNLQRTYLLLLLSRVYEFIPDLSKADEKLKDALAIEPLCPEGTYEQIIRYFRGRREADATNRLVKLIRIYKEYYPATLISPELAKFRDVFSPEFEKLVVQTRGEAGKAAEEADKEVALLKGFVGENDSDVAQVLSSHKQMRELIEKPEALFNYHEAIAMAARIVAECKELDKERAEHAGSVIQKVENRVDEAVQRSAQPHKAVALFQRILDRVARLKEELQARAPLAPCLAQCEEMERETDAIEVQIKELDVRHALMQMWTRLSKQIILISFVTATLGLVFFPGAVSLLHALRPDVLTLESSEIWAGQKAILLTGTLFAAIFAAFHAVLDRRSVPKPKSPE